MRFDKVRIVLQGFIEAFCSAFDLILSNCQQQVSMGGVRLSQISQSTEQQQEILNSLEIKLWPSY